MFINNYLGKPCGGGNNNKIVHFFFFFVFVLFFFFLFTYLNVFIDGASFDHPRYTWTLWYNGVEVYYLKGFIGLPIVINFRDRWYYIFTLEIGSLMTSWLVIGWTDSDFRISRALIAALFLSLWCQKAIDRGLSVKPGLWHLGHWQRV